MRRCSDNKGHLVLAWRSLSREGAPCFHEGNGTQREESNHECTKAEPDFTLVCNPTAGLVRDSLNRGRVVSGRPASIQASVSNCGTDTWLQHRLHPFLQERHLQEEVEADLGELHQAAVNLVLRSTRRSRLSLRGGGALLSRRHGNTGEKGTRHAHAHTVLVHGLGLRRRHVTQPTADR